MAGSINKVILIGNLGRDPEIKSMNNGDKVCNLSVATSESWKDKNSGERQERTEWHRVVLFDQHLIEICEKYLAKGRKIYLEGQLQTRKWTDQAGVEKYSTEVVLQRFRGVLQILDKDPNASNSYTEQRSASSGSGQSAYNGPSEKHQEQYGGGDLDDEIPFNACKLI